MEIFMMLAAAVIGVITAVLNNRLAEQREKQQADYNTEALEKQEELNEQAALKSYDLETNYSDRMQKLQAAGLNSHFAAQILGGAATAYQPPSVSVNQAQQKHAPDMSAIMAALPTMANSMQDRQLKREENAMNRDLQQQQIDIQKQVADIQKQVDLGNLSIQQGMYKVWEAQQNCLVPNPTDKNLPAVPYWYAEQVAKGKTFQQNIALADINEQMSQEQLNEYKEQVNRNAETWKYELKFMADKAKMNRETIRQMKSQATILEKEASPQWLAIRYNLMYYQYLDSKQKAALKKKIEQMPEGPGKTAAETIISYLPEIFSAFSKFIP